MPTIDEVLNEPERDEPRKITVSPETHARLMKIKHDEGRKSVDAVLRLLLDAEEARRRKEADETNH